MATRVDPKVLEVPREAVDLAGLAAQRVAGSEEGSLAEIAGPRSGTRQVSRLRRALRRIRWALDDSWSRVGRLMVPPHMGSAQHGLQPYQVYPAGRHFTATFLTEPADRFPKLIDKRYLREAQFDFVSTRESWAGSAEWGRVDTTKNMLQIFQLTFGRLRPDIRFCRTAQGVFDPYREGVWYAAEAAAEEGIARDYEESRAALTTCDVLIVTPGQNEAWLDTQSGLVWARKPAQDVLAQYGDGRFYVKRFSVAENVEYLTGLLALVWEHNPEAKVIFTVSPVPSSATFADVNVGIRSFENKAILLLAVKEAVARNPGRAFYFPSFEMAMLPRNGNLRLDNRHVRPTVIDDIMAAFERCFVATP